MSAITAAMTPTSHTSATERIVRNGSIAVCYGISNARYELYYMADDSNRKRK